MSHVFINYRSDDADEAATLIETGLSARFGTDAIFRAGKSILPGESFEDALLRGARSCSVLLAVMGPDWSLSPLLHDPDDWVRREIIEAWAYGATVISVMKGRKSDRLEGSHLPPELRRLANDQSMILDHRDDGSSLRRIGDRIAQLVPALKEADTSAEPAGSVANAAQQTDGPVVQTRDVGGDAGTVIKDNHGQVHTGRGNIHKDSYNYGAGSFTVQGDNHGGISSRVERPSHDEDHR